MSTYELRPLKKEDYSTIVHWLSTPQNLFTVCANLFVHPLSEEAFCDFFVHGTGQEHGKLCYAYVNTESNELVGMISYNKMDAQNHAGHIGFVATAPEVRGKGIGSGMFSAMLSLGFNQLGFHRVSLFVLERNERAHAFYEKIGFRTEGLQRDLICTDDGYHSCYAMSMLADEWQKTA